MQHFGRERNTDEVVGEKQAQHMQMEELEATGLEVREHWDGGVVKQSACAPEVPMSQGASQEVLCQSVLGSETWELSVHWIVVKYWKCLQNQAQDPWVWSCGAHLGQADVPSPWWAWLIMKLQNSPLAVSVKLELGYC